MFYTHNVKQNLYKYLNIYIYKCKQHIISFLAYYPEYCVNVNDTTLSLKNKNYVIHDRFNNLKCEINIIKFEIKFYSIQSCIKRGSNVNLYNIRHVLIFNCFFLECQINVIPFLLL